MKKALTTGVTGQSSSYLAEFLLDKGYEVHGIIRSLSIRTTIRVDNLIARGCIKPHDGDLADSSSLDRIVSEFSERAFENVGIPFVGKVRALTNAALMPKATKCSFVSIPPFIDRLTW